MNQGQRSDGNSWHETNTQALVFISYFWKDAEMRIPPEPAVKLLQKPFSLQACLCHIHTWFHCACDCGCRCKAMAPLRGSQLNTVLLVSPLCTSSHAHTQDLCSSTPENLLGFCTWVACFQKCNPKPRHCLKLTAENAAALCPDVNARAVFSVIFITHSTFPVSAF